MRAINIDMVLSQIIFWGVFIKGLFILIKFIKSDKQTGGRIRRLIIELFIAIVWLFGCAGIYYMFYDLGFFRQNLAVWLRIICNLPLFIIMFKFDKYLDK